MKKNILIILVVAIVSFLLGVALNYNKPSVHEKTSPSVLVKPLKSHEIDLKASNSIVYEYHLQLGAFKVPYFASQLAHKVKKRGYTVVLRSEIVKNQTYTLVEVGPFKKYSQAIKHKKFLEKDNPSLGKTSLKKRIKD